MRALRIILGCAALVACAHTQTPAETPATKPEPVAQSAPAPAVVPAPAPAPSAPAVKEAQPPAFAADVPAARLYFAFDKAFLDESSRSSLQGLANVAASAPGTRIRIEGNCDERGSAEYNIGLGQRRADAAKTYLIHLGIPEASIAAISYGEERPKLLGHDEESWRENRRDDVFVQSAVKVGLK